MSVVHLAGIDVEAEGVLRQRCSWCGALLLEVELARVAYSIKPGDDPEKPRRPATWPVGDFVRIEDHLDAGGPRIGELLEAEPHPDNPERYKIPDGACFHLDRAVTA